MRKKIKQYLEVWRKRCYFDDIPDEAPSRLEALGKVPSYRRIALAILNNDNNLISLGFTPKKSEVYNQLKKIELNKRDPIKYKFKPKQKTLFDQ